MSDFRLLHRPKRPGYSIDVLKIFVNFDHVKSIEFDYLTATSILNFIDGTSLVVSEATNQIFPPIRG